MTPPFSPDGQLRALLRVEVALAEASALAGLIPASSLDAIRAAADPSAFDAAALAEQAVRAGNIVIPLVEALAARAGAVNADAAGHVHLGATSQDILDTALVLQIREAWKQIESALEHAASDAARLARTHAATPMAGRTWLQQASPVTFGLKAADWLDALERARMRLGVAVSEANVVQLGGAAGTLTAFGPAGPAIVRGLATALEMRAPLRPWHTTRDRVTEVAAALGIACGTAAKIAHDVTLLAQTEVGEVSEGAAPGRGGSSSMPHKRNPVDAVRVRAAAAQAPGLVATMLAAMVQEHERAAGGWQAEWLALPALVAHTHEAARALADLLARLEVHADRMRANLDLHGGVARAEGLTTALVPRLGRVEAMRLVSAACARAATEAVPLADVATRMPEIAAVLDHAAITAALDPATLTAGAAPWVQRVLEAWRR